MEDFDPLNSEAIDDLIAELGITVMEDGPPDWPAKEREWCMSWKHGGMCLMLAHDKSEEEARSAAALFAILWLGQGQVGAGKLKVGVGECRDIAVIYVNRCFDVARWAREDGAKPDRCPPSPHKTVPMQVWVDVDLGVAGLVSQLNSIHGVRTHSSCQGTIGEGGPEPYGPYVVASYPPEAEKMVLSEFDTSPGGEGWCYVHRSRAFDHCMPASDFMD